MIFTESYNIDYLESVMSLVDTMKIHPDKRVSRVAFDESGNKFAVIFCDKKTNTTAQKVETIISNPVSEIPIFTIETNDAPITPDAPVIKKTHTRRNNDNVIPWEDSEKVAVVNATSKNHAIEVYRKTFPDSKRTDASIVAYFYWKNYRKGAKQ